MTASTKTRFDRVLREMGSDVTFHREEGGTACPCRTPEGFRDPAWHRVHPPGRPAGLNLGMNWCYDGNGHVAAVYYGIEAGNKNLAADYGNVTNFVDDGTGWVVIDGVVGPAGPFEARLFVGLGVAEYDHTFTMGTPEGSQKPFESGFLVINPPVCNEQGFIPVVTEFPVRASVQPAISGLSRHAQRSNALLGEVLRDDKVGIFPCHWNGHVLDFEDWSDAGEDFIVYDGNRYVAISADKLPDVNGDVDHHWEVGLRIVKPGRPV